ncbi:hypothetical protein PLICRDRAFT_312465 [Plicaturopsis crispa FD-325 SS-3]|nr:hypothetical protein PLICRDRAFT_312465 [Plicaturopsis crispa FD-325 SS-3]
MRGKACTNTRRVYAPLFTLITPRSTTARLVFAQATPSSLEPHPLGPNHWHASLLFRTR